MTMRTTVNVVCDGENCDHTRAGDSNHWLTGAVEQKTILLSISDNILAVVDEDSDITREELKDFCGEECAIKWVSKMLAEIKK